MSKNVIVLAGLVLMLFASCKQEQKEAVVNEIETFDRASLNQYITTYMDAVVARDPSQTPLAEQVKFTENGQRLVPGDGLWNTASGWGKYSIVVADTVKGEVGFMGTIMENEKPAIMSLRLKIKNKQISEIETFVARSDSGALKLHEIGNPSTLFFDKIPKEKRISRDSLITIANTYFDAVEQNDGKGLYLFTDDCNRLENGKQTTNNANNDGRPFDIDALGTKEQFETGFFKFVTRVRDRRFTMIDEERGLVYAFAFFDHAGNVHEVTLTNGMTIPIGITEPWTWEIAELFKIEDGLIHQIEALYQRAPYGMGSGWSTWEQTLSSEPIK